MLKKLKKLLGSTFGLLFVALCFLAGCAGALYLIWMVLRLVASFIF
jgi:hypothetical protein